MKQPRTRDIRPISGTSHLLTLCLIRPPADKVRAIAQGGHAAPSRGKTTNPTLQITEVQEGSDTHAPGNMTS